MRHGERPKKVRSKRRGRRSSTSRQKVTGGNTSDDATVFPIVGIGASAGGLAALKTFFSAMPADSGMGFVIIQHLDPTHESLTAELVSKCTRMPVAQVGSDMRVETNRVYVIPPNKYLSLSERTLRLSPPTAPRGLRLPVDFFLRSLAEEQHERAIGIILSGTGTDGTLGLKEIKAAGGMTMVQDPSTAQHDGMPRSAIAGGSADYVLPAEEMPKALFNYRQHPYVTETVKAAAPLEPVPDRLNNVVALLRARTRFDFSCYRQGTMQRRIQRRMSLRHVEEIPAYVELLRGDPAEVTALFKDLLINVTSFFREPKAWQFLQEQVIQRLIAGRDSNDLLRVWVPGCATGEEAYSLAITLIEEMQAARKGCSLQIFASDIDADVLEVGRAGVYPQNIAADVPPERLRRFFLKGEHGYRVNKELRDAVMFAQQNLVSDPPFSRLDLISCRNLLIYLEPPAQEKVISLLHFALAEGGYLFLGNTEGIGQHEDLFKAVSKKWRVYRRLGPRRHDKVPFPIISGPPAGRERVVPTGPNAGRLATLAQHLLLERYAPACVVINRKREILYFHGRTEDYLVQPTGSPTQDLIAKAREGLQTKLRGAVHRAMREEHSVVIYGAHVRRGKTSCRVKVMVEPLKAATEAEGLLLVSFEDESETRSSAPAVAHAGDASDRTDEALVRQVEYELRTTKEDLQSTIDELGASNEELKAANEEVMSINEELQASNEELETSKEELQSLNEELSTVNTQLESKVAELAATNTDLDNLLTSTNLATLFLDTHLCIRRFTPAATKLFSLIPSDAGRPISDIAQKFADPDLGRDLEAVLAEPGACNKEVQADNGRWYIRQVLPYRTHDNRTDGVVITFSDVAAEALGEARLYAESIVETVREPLLVLNGDLRVRSANHSFYDTFQVSQEQTVGRPLYELGNSQWDIPALRELLGSILPKHLVLNDFEVEHEFQTIGRRSMLLNGRALLRGGGRPGLILLAIEDVTERKRAQEAILESEVRKQVEEQRQQHQAELAHVLRIATIGELASGLAHELNQPLSAIANGLEACAQYVRSGEPDSTKLLALLDDASAEALRTGEIVEHLRGSIQKGQPQFEQTDLGEIAHTVPRLLKHEIEQEQITLRLDLGPHPLPIYADRIQIEQVLVNLMQNAIDAVRDTSRDRKEIQLSACSVEGMVEVAVRDTGIGISAAAAARLFEPFFTTKPRGLGMGLAISRSIIEAHQGRIWVERPADGNLGTTVRFTLPLHAPTPARKRRST